MCFLNPLIAEGFAGSSWSPLFMNAQLEEELWLRVLRESKDTTLLKVPIDQSKFDHAPSRRMLDIFFKKVVSISKQYGTDEEVRMSELLYESMLHHNSTVRVEKEVVRFRKGVASGWRWTSLIGTLLNRIEFEVMKRIVEDKIHRPLRVSGRSFFGDDVQLSMREKREVAQLLLDTYISCGFTVHSGKNEIMEDCDEFLRLTVDNEVIVGYPARLVVSIVYSKPGKDRPVSKFERIHGMVTSHIRLYQRGCDANKYILESNQLCSLRH